MRILMLDLDTLRPDHLSCYGYPRQTSPALDRICRDSLRFDNYHCSDAPCLPSRAALVTGMFGIRNGAVNHGGRAADLRIGGIDRWFRDQRLDGGLFNLFRRAGLRTATVSTFAERHSSYWFNAGFNEIINIGKRGDELAGEVLPPALDWLEKNAAADNWFLHINMWDPHTPYRTPCSFGSPFENNPLPSWLSDEVISAHLQHVGPHSLKELGMYSDSFSPDLPRQLGRAETPAEVKQVIDGYDCGIRYMDEKIGAILSILEERGLYEDTAIIVTSDHGENMGELGIYSEHATADEITTRIPMLIKWPGMKTGIDQGLHYSLDLLPTLASLFGIPASPEWDGASYAETLKDGKETGRPYLVLSQCAHVCQRSVRFGDYLYIRTYHDGYHLFPPEMLFNVKDDFHEQRNLTEERPDIAAEACRFLVEWQGEMMFKSDSDADPLWTVIREGGPFHARGNLKGYYERLKKTGRAEGAEELRRRHPGEFNG
jgi:arylsulfatase A-like enzyme